VTYDVKVSLCFTRKYKVIWKSFFPGTPSVVVVVVALSFLLNQKKKRGSKEEATDRNLY